MPNLNLSPEQKTTVRQRENCAEANSRKAAFGLRLRAGLAAPNRVWDFSRLQSMELVFGQRADSNRD